RRRERWPTKCSAGWPTSRYRPTTSRQRSGCGAGARGLGQKLVRAHPDLPAYQGDLSDVHGRLANLLSGLGKPEEALKEYQQACDLHLKLVEAYPEVVKYQISLAATYCNMGNLLQDNGKV